MIHKEQALKNGIKVIDSKESHNALFENLKTYFPQTIKDNQVDLQAIATLLGLETKANIQGYELTFTGKALANALYSTPTQKLLKFEESFNVRSAESSKEDSNFIIKGDNLDVLKILKSAYSEKIKMIYIDPPYNTKNENFIYPDNFRKDYKAILQEVGLLEIDDEGNEVESETLQFFKNIQGSRTHSGWLSFMLPRLKLARDLLREDGVIFISIDDNEQANLKILCDEIFGEENFVGDFIVQHNPRGRSLDKILAQTHEYCICYCKNIYNLNSFLLKKNEKGMSEYNKSDECGLYREMRLMNGNRNFTKKERPNLYFPLYVNPNTCKVSLIKDENFTDEVLPINSFNSEQCWTWSKEKVKKENNMIIARKTKDNEWRIYRKDYLNNTSSLTKTKTLLIDKMFNNENGTELIRKLFGKDVFNTPKPIELIIHLLKISTSQKDSDYILDFFAGSGTTAHAVMELNAEDGGNRKFILVQIDEPINESKNKTAYDFCKNELKSKNPAISDITIERVKRAGAKIANANPNFSVSFSVLALSDKPELISTEQGTLKLLSNANLSPFDKALNLALQSGKTLDKPLKTIFENKLYQCEDCLYLIACDKEVLEFLRKSQNEYIFIDGFEDLHLEDFLNLDSSLNDRLRVVY